ncbi:hypothetical protein C8R45DRAFT_419001 [Mycena sanguinolenta]|nr:hypothetical protein C8R45DRAFT_419001 [Mycena sanguinolenta]
MDLFSGNTVHIVENTTTTTSTGGVIPTSTPSPNPTSTRTSLNAGTIFVIVLGAVTAIGILGVFLVLAVRRMRTVDANVDPFERIHASEASQIQASPPPSMRFEKFRAVARDGQNNLAVQIGALRRQLENLRGVYDQPDGAVDQVGILQARIRMLEHELESLGGPEPPPEYPHQ